MRFLTVVFFTFLISSCTSTDEFSSEPCFSTNFDEIAGWVPEQKLLYGDARSGNWSVMVDNHADFGILWRRSINRISDSPLTKIRISAYVKSKLKKSDACIVVSIDSNDKNLFWSSLDLNKYKLNKKSWTRVEAFFDFPVVQDAAATMTIYLWSKNGSHAIMDDLELEFSI